MTRARRVGDPAGGEGDGDTRRSEIGARQGGDLIPGERLQVANAAAPPKVDRPPLEAVTAWRSGEILLDDTPLSQAIAELNRYSPTPLEIESPEVASLRVSGIFKSGESESFARTVAAQYGLAVVEQPGRILLAQPQGAS